MKTKNIITSVVFLIGAIFVNAQETLPIYSDYLSDNVYLVHPAAAGIGNCGKLRITARSQWEDNYLQTMSFHTRIGEKGAVGGILFNDKNGYHYQQGIIGTYAYHIELGRIDDVNMLSFGLSVMLVQNSIDETPFTIPDPVITQLIQSRNYVNSDFGMAYHNKGFSSYFTVKNLLLSARNLYDDNYESLNLRYYLASVGYYFDWDKIQFEPSVMVKLIEKTGENYIDLNAKVYKRFENAQVWAGVSYRQGFDGNNTEELRYISPIVGVNFRRFMVGYTYTNQTGNYVYEGSFHQISLGLNVFCKEPRGAGCPNINASF